MAVAATRRPSRFMSELRDRFDAAAAAPPLCNLAADQRSELERELAAAPSFEDLPGKWQAALLEAEAQGTAR